VELVVQVLDTLNFLRPLVLQDQIQAEDILRLVEVEDLILALEVLLVMELDQIVGVVVVQEAKLQDLVLL
jgi:hypothetical protein